MPHAPIAPALASLLTRWRGYGYGPRVADGQVDCSTLIAHVLRDHYGLEAITPEVWRDVCLSTPAHLARPWAPVDAVADALGGHPVYPWQGPERPEPGRVHLCQGWRRLTTEGIGPGSRGHAWLWWASADPWQGVAIESTTGDGVSGPSVLTEHARVPLAGALYPDGHWSLPGLPGSVATDWQRRAAPWTSGVAWAVLP